MRTLAVAWSVGWVAFFLGWKLGRKEFAYWLVRHPEWKGLTTDHSDGPAECPDCGEALNDDYVTEHRWLWHGGPKPAHIDGSTPTGE